MHLCMACLTTSVCPPLNTATTLEVHTSCNALIHGVNTVKVAGFCHEHASIAAALEGTHLQGTKTEGQLDCVEAQSFLPQDDCCQVQALRAEATSETLHKLQAHSCQPGGTCKHVWSYAACMQVPAAALTITSGYVALCCWCQSACGICTRHSTLIFMTHMQRVLLLHKRRAWRAED
jgi:hypothetical protein